MSIEKRAESLLGMSDAIWQRHANPYSVWTRYACLPLLCVAIWSRAWIGWYHLLPVALVLLWIWLNPRVFPKPRSTHHWASKAVLGERILLRHPRAEIPQHHLSMIMVLKIIMTCGTLAAIYGLVMLHLWWTSLGTIVVILAKTWFLDRMVWLCDDLIASREEYQGWLYDAS